jgi:hypothetical protein
VIVCVLLRAGCNLPLCARQAERNRQHHVHSEQPNPERLDICNDAA